MSHTGGLTAAGGAGGVWPAFTVAQWQELEHQAFIFKYMKAGIPVPPDLLAPIRMSLESISARLFHLPPLGYSSPYGKKYDPEPGRCRRTDGKKWRCAKDAYPDSKYCERHMNRTRNRSRKLVESKTTSHSVSTVASATSNASGSSQNQPLQSYGNQDGLYRRSNASQLQLESIPYGVCNKEYRGQHGQKPEPAKHSFIPEVSRSLTSIGSNSNASSEWCFPTAQIASYPISEPSTGTLLQFNRPQDYEPAVSVDAAMSKQQQEHYFFGMEFNSGIPMKQDNQSLQPLFDDWPKSRDFGSYTGDPKSDMKLHSTTQLSMSTPMAPSDFFSRRAHSPNDG